MFELLFKYQPDFFERGRFILAAPGWVYLLAVAVAALAVPTLLRYAGAGGVADWRDRTLLSLLRTAALALVIFCLFQPALVLSNTVAGRSFVGLLVDGSASMAIADGDSATRADFVRQQMDPEGSGLLPALSARFGVRAFRFGGSAERLPDDTAVSFDEPETDLAAALDDAMDTLGGAPLAGLVVLSDGADNGAGDMAKALRRARAAGVPVYTVGVGAERFQRDIEIGVVDLPSSVLNGSAVVAELTVRQSGFSGQTLPLIVEDEASILAKQDVTLGAEGEAVSVRLTLAMEQPGPRRLRFRMPVQTGETLARNNVRHELIDVRDRAEKILYVEGEPRYEVKFARRALAEDENIQLVVLIRTAEAKFYRVGIDDADELSEGFPTSREQLFGYRGLIIGNVEAAFFNREQQQMIVDFVSERGGSVLFLGGKKSFGEGGYESTPIADLMPLELTESPVVIQPSRLKITPTLQGRGHPLTQLAGDQELSLERWKALPALSMVNVLGPPKPGASVLLEGGYGEQIKPVLAWQRFGRGQSMAVPLTDLWWWRMSAEVAPEDKTLETFWRQLARWLVSPVPDRLQVALPAAAITPGEAVELTAKYVDESFAGLNGAAVEALAISPSGQESSMPMEPTLTDDGEYALTFTPREQGLHEIQIRARESDDADTETQQQHTVYLAANADAREYFQAEQRVSLLRNVAETTGGAYYNSTDAGALAQAIQPAASGATVTERYELWDMPALLLLFFGLVGGEWSYRRWRKLP